MIINPDDYERIYKVINSVVLNEGVSSDVSCILFSFFGAHILKNHYDLNALPKAGFAAYKLGSNDNSMITAGKAESYHCWIEVDGWLIDFMAPAFANLQSKQDGGDKVLAKMMQKPLSSMSASVEDIAQVGDFYIEANNAVLADKYTVIKNTPVFGDLASVCSHWYKKTPESLKSKMTIEDQNGKLTSILLQGETLFGAW